MKTLIGLLALFIITLTQNAGAQNFDFSFEGMAVNYTQATGEIAIHSTANQLNQTAPPLNNLPDGYGKVFAIYWRMIGDEFFDNTLATFSSAPTSITGSLNFGSGAYVSGQNYELFSEVFIITDQDSILGPWRSDTSTHLFGEEIVTSISQSEKEKFQIFPNPTTDYLFFHPGATEEIENLSILNVAGQKVMDVKNGSEKVYVGNLPTGVYCLITSDGIRKKFVKV